MCTRAPASRASSASRATIDSSAARGQPDKPNRAALGPSCATAPTVSRGSSACWAISTPSPVAYSKRTTHHQRVVHADAVVGEHAHLGRARGHHSHLGELGSGQSHGDRADRVHVDQADLLAAVPHVVGDHRAVRHRRGVGHREDCGVAAQSCCGRTGFDVFGVFAARFAQVGVQVDEAGQQDLAGGVDRRRHRRGWTGPPRCR